MNTIVAQGAPNSLIRHFQEKPEDGVALYKALLAMMEDTDHIHQPGNMLHLSRVMAYQAIALLPDGYNVRAEL